jgi:hypothetical protein
LQASKVKESQALGFAPNVRSLEELDQMGKQPGNLVPLEPGIITF